MNAVVTPDSSLARVRSHVLDAAGIADRDLERALGTLMRGAVDNADLYFEVSRQESWTLEDGIVKEGAHSIEQGVGVRAMSGEKTGFAYSDEVMVPALLQASAAASAIVRQGQQGRVQAWQPRDGHRLYAPIDPLPTLNDDDKVALLQRVDREVRALDPRVKQVVASLAAAHDVVLVCASDGTMAADIRPLVRFNISVIVEDGDKREQGYSGGGGRFGYEHFTPERVLDFGREAVRQAIVNLDAVPAPSGEMIVVLGPGWPGVLLHEAIGLGLEGDFNR
jgi:TldD protein